LLDAAGVGPGSRVLEIGTGWGELCLRAAARGAHVRSVTLSTAQRETATQRVAEAGCADRVEIDVCDYRHVDGAYDAVISVEMIEAVGLERLPEYFRSIDRVLAPGGRVALQTILMDDHRVETTRRNYTWVHKYVFPGGRIPSVEAIERALPGTRLHRTETTSFGIHYARTLRLWRDRFDARRDEVAALGFADTFRRLWRFYLAYSEAGFRSGYLDVAQIILEANRCPPAPRTPPPPWRPHSPRRSPHCSAVRCRCAWSVGTAALPVPTTRPSCASPRPRRCAGSCVLPASWARPRRT